MDTQSPLHAVPDNLVQTDPFAVENWFVFVFVDLLSGCNNVAVETGQTSVICYMPGP